MIATKPREVVRAVTPYLPGKPIGEVQRELGIKDVVKLASNENPLGASPRALAAVAKAARQLALYPEGSSPLLRDRLAAQLKVGRERVIVGNGSDEIIRLVCLAFVSEGDPVVVSQYGFIRFKQAASLMGAKVVEVPMRDYRHDLAAMAAACTPRTKAVFVASPNNPTGTYNTAAEVKTFLRAVPRNTVVVLDEAYWHYAQGRADYHGDSVPELLKAHPNLLVVRTFSKAYGLAGLRVGYGVGDAELVSWLDRVRMPFNVNSLGQHGAAAALGDAAFLRDSLKLVETERPALRRALTALGLPSTDSTANFLFVHTRRDAKGLFQQLLRQGVIVRPLGEYGLPEHIRVSIGTPVQNRRLVAALRIALGGNGHAPHRTYA